MSSSKYHLIKALCRGICLTSSPISVPPINPRGTPLKCSGRLANHDSKVNLSRSSGELSFLTRFGNPRR